MNQPGYSTYDTDPAATFDGSTAYAQVPYYAYLNPPVFSLECWLYPTAGDYRSPFSNRDTAYGPQGYILYANDSDQWSFWIGSGSGWNQAIGSTVALNQWTHVVGTFDGTNQVLYVNGQQVVSQRAFLSANTQRPLNIGVGKNESPPPVFYWPGRIDEMAVYAAALTANQVLDHYALATTGTLPSQTLHYTFSNGKLTLSWTTGTLLQAPQVLGPWTTNLAASPFDVNPTNAQTYYRLITK